MKPILQFLALLMLISTSYNCERNLHPYREENPDSFQVNTMIYFFGLRHAGIPADRPEAILINDLDAGKNRALISWYVIDPVFFGTHALRPDYIAPVDDQNPYVARVRTWPLFTNTSLDPEKDTSEYYEAPLNISFYPRERGIYNFDTYPSEYSAGINEEGNLLDPQSRWGGVIAELITPDAAISHVEFWLMDPFVKSENLNGDLFINLGRISEDILPDGNLQCVTSLSADPGENDSTVWGLIGSEECQDGSQFASQRGLDGLRNEDEKNYFSDYLSDIITICNSETFVKIAADPSNDDFSHYLEEKFTLREAGINDRYKFFRHMERIENYDVPYAYHVSVQDNEDLNYNGILDTDNSYYEYRISMRKEDFIAGENFIDSVRTASVIFPDGGEGEADFYHFTLPLGSFTSEIGGPVDDLELSTLRLWLTGFEDPVFLRFLKFRVYWDLMIQPDEFDNY